MLSSVDWDIVEGMKVDRYMHGSLHACIHCDIEDELVYAKSRGTSDAN